MLLPIKDMAGKQMGELEVSDAVFAAPVNKSLMHQALVRQLANARLGNHSTKTRGQVRGGGRKPWRQKGTGRARQGSTRSPNWVGGGAVFDDFPVLALFYHHQSLAIDDLEVIAAVVLIERHHGPLAFHADAEIR